MSRLGESRRVFFTHTRRHCVVTCVVRRLKSSSPSACEVPFLAPSTRVSRRPRGRASPQRLAGHAHVSLCDGPARASRSLRRGLITCCCAHHRPWSPRVTAQADDCGAGARERKGHRRRDAGCSRRPAPLRPLPAASAPTPGPAQLPPPSAARRHFRRSRRRRAQALGASGRVRATTALRVVCVARAWVCACACVWRCGTPLLRDSAVRFYRGPCPLTRRCRSACGPCERSRCDRPGGVSAAVPAPLR